MTTKRTTRKTRRPSKPGAKNTTDGGSGRTAARKRTTKAGVPQAKRKAAAKKKRRATVAIDAISDDAPPETGEEGAPPAGRSSAARVQPARATSAPTSADRRLETVLRALPPRELEALIARMKIRVDLKKRIDSPAQVARALVRLPELRDPSRLPSASKELLRRVAEANGTLRVVTLPSGLELLVRRGVLYARADDDGIELVLPTAFLIQMKPWDGEDPRSLRVLLAEAPFETAGAVASHHLGRPSTPPVALGLEAAWEVLGDPSRRAKELAAVSHQERRLLQQIDEVGGEVETQELMDLEREPMRVRGAYGVAAGRRGAAFSLEKRGFLFPLHPNRYVVPTEIAHFVGAERRSARERRREEIREHVFAEDHLPRRARFATDPAPVALALAIHARRTKGEVKDGVGTPKTLVQRLASRVGREPATASMLIAFSRAIGLWERDPISAAVPPGSVTLAELTLALFQAWRRGGVWDEGREEPEVWRAPSELREVSPAGVVREMVLDALVDLGEDQWVPMSALMAYLNADPRRPGFDRVAARWAGRVGLSAPSAADVAARMLVSSLPALGVVDLGGADRDVAPVDPQTHHQLALRLTARGRRLLAGDVDVRGEDSEFVVDGEIGGGEDLVFRLAVGPTARVAEVFALLPFAEVRASDRRLELEVTRPTLAAGLALGIQTAEMGEALSAFAPLPTALQTALDRAGAVIGRASLVAVGGFLWVDDPEVRRLLTSSSNTADMFVDPSPPGGLLVKAPVEPDRLARRCRGLGVDVTIDDEGFVAHPTTSRTSSMPPPKRSATQKVASWRPPDERRRTSSEP
ncbi:MAG: hypothetical protein AAGN82_10485 [Myxococcota bacterium]